MNVQDYQLILGDIAMGAAIAVHDSTYAAAYAGSEYTPGQVRDRWLAARAENADLQSRVLAMANAAAGALQTMPADRLEETARRYGVKLTLADAERVTSYFLQRQSAVMRYRS